MKEEKEAGLLLTESLAVKYRPKVLADLVGQDGVQQQIAGMIKKKRFAKVYLVTGNSGVGKTTVANLINRYVNCATYDACGTCDSCTHISHPDLLEVNVGDSRGIDAIRSIVDTSKLMPRYHKRIILLDEAHALTKQAEACLLVPLEKASKNTIFILASTNPEKILPTIRGRCIRFELTTITPDVIAKRLFKIAKREGYNFNDLDNGIEALELIGEMSNGQMRDAIQYLESLLYIIESGKSDLDIRKIVTKFIGNVAADLDTKAANLLLAMVELDIKTMLKLTLIEDNPRQLMSKMRWLIHILMRRHVGVDIDPRTNQKIWKSLAEKHWLEISKNTKIKFGDFTILQMYLSETEVTMNNSSVEERILLVSMLGKYIEFTKSLKRPGPKE